MRNPAPEEAQNPIGQGERPPRAAPLKFQTVSQYPPYLYPAKNSEYFSADFRPPSQADLQSAAARRADGGFRQNRAEPRGVLQIDSETGAAVPGNADSPAKILTFFKAPPENFTGQRLRREKPQGAPAFRRRETVPQKRPQKPGGQKSPKPRK